MEQMQRTRALIMAVVALLFAPVARGETVPSGTGSDDRERALRCMTLAIAYEAGFEPLEGQQAVAEVILNRTRHPAYPKSVCGVVFQGSARRTGCQFTFTCDGAMAHTLSGRVMIAAREVARRALSGEAVTRIGGATHYHASYVSPYWAPSLIRVGRIGAHIFYRAPGSLDMPARYAGGTEPEIGAQGAWEGATDPLIQGGSAGSVVPKQGHAMPATPPAAFTPWGLSVR